MLEKLSLGILTGYTPVVDPDVEKTMRKIRFFSRKENKLLERIEREPQNPEHHLRLGKLYFLHGDFRKAVEAYQRGLKAVPRDTSILYNYAITREAQQNLEAAKELYLEILSVDPNHQAAQEHLDRITDF